MRTSGKTVSNPSMKLIMKYIVVLCSCRFDRGITHPSFCHVWVIGPAVSVKKNLSRPQHRERISSSSPQSLSACLIKNMLLLQVFFSIYSFNNLWHYIRMFLNTLMALSRVIQIQDWIKKKYSFVGIKF